LRIALESAYPQYNAAAGVVMYGGKPAPLIGRSVAMGTPPPATA